MKCFYCGKEINTNSGEKAMMIAVDRPMINLFFHMDTCYREIKNREWDYLKENSERIWQQDISTIKKDKATKRK